MAMFDHFSPVLDPVAGKVLAVAENAIHFTFRWAEITINLFFFCSEEAAFFIHKNDINSNSHVIFFSFVHDLFSSYRQSLTMSPSNPSFTSF